MMKKILRIIYLNYVIPMFKLEKKYITKKFKNVLGYEIDFKQEPQSFNQKIQFRKVYDKNPLFTLCADKYKVREYVRNKIGEEYLIPLYLVTDKLKKEDFKDLPNSFIIKNNHASGKAFYEIVTDKNKVDLSMLCKKFNKNVKKKIGFKGFEYFYDEIKPRIIIEKLINEKDKELLEYKMHCFRKENNRYTIIIQLSVLINNKRYLNFYDENWNFMKFTKDYENIPIKINKPKNFALLKKIAIKLASDFDYVRVDLYNVNNKIYFGELTFTSSGGYGKFDPPEYDFKIGAMWNFKKRKDVKS